MLQAEIGQRQLDQFGTRSPPAKAQVQHGAVPDAEPGRQVRGGEDRANLVHREMAHQFLVVPLGGNGVDLPHLLDHLGNAQLDIPHEGLDRGEPDVAGGCAVAALLLDMGEEVQHQRSIEVLEAELGWPQASTLTGEDQPKSQGMGVAFAGLRTAALRDRHVLAQEAGDQRGNRRCPAPPSRRAAPRRRYRPSAPALPPGTSRYGRSSVAHVGRQGDEVAGDPLVASSSNVAALASAKVCRRSWIRHARAPVVAISASHKHAAEGVVRC